MALIFGHKGEFWKIRRFQQTRNDSIIREGIVGNKLFGPYKGDEGVNLNSANYREFLSSTFFKWFMSQSRSLKAKNVLCLTSLRHMLPMSLVDF